METKTFSVVTSIAMVVTLTAAILSIIGVAITGLYSGIFVFWVLALIQLLLCFTLKEIVASLFKSTIQKHSQLLIC
ncbi:hypothetical protein [Flavobacterium psychrotolerans]|uniref:hypothetical protein n=1 Tax=Flavobacterium psychrotolerans TaxID=2169410 RepID=UPI001AA08169|nr:hypothetical protein [Flavobacterium psychrotolerans]